VEIGDNSIDESNQNTPRIKHVNGDYGNFNLSRKFIRLLIVAGFDSDRLLLRDGKKLSWQKGLDRTEGVVRDSLTAVVLNKKLHAIPFRLIAESSLQDLKRYEQFITFLDLKSCAPETAN